MNQIAGKTLMLIAVAGLSLQAAEAQAHISHICPTHDRSSQQLSVRIGSGCMTGMARFKSHNLLIEVDQERAHIIVTGGIQFHKITSPVVTADCAGEQSFTLTETGVEPRRYTLSYNGDYLGVYDLLEQAENPACFGTNRNKLRSQSQVISDSQFAEWQFDPQGDWKVWRGESVTALLEPLLGSAPESLEGRPEVEIRMNRRRWRNTNAGPKPGYRNRQPFIAVWITRHGLADDSISGDRFFVAVIQASGGWKVDKLWRQQMCARGERAGQWSASTCP